MCALDYFEFIECVVNFRQNDKKKLAAVQVPMSPRMSIHMKHTKEHALLLV